MHTCVSFHSLHYALPILAAELADDPVIDGDVVATGGDRSGEVDLALRFGHPAIFAACARSPPPIGEGRGASGRADRKSTRLNSSHVTTSYAVFCLKKNTR